MVGSPPSVEQSRVERMPDSPSHYPVIESPASVSQPKHERIASSPSVSPPHYSMMDSRQTLPESPSSVPEVEGRTEIHIPGDQIEVKHEVVVCSEDESEKPFTSRPFDVENLLAPKRPASY